MSFNKKTIRDVDVAHKTILVRVDYNVPLKDGQVVNDLRIRASLPTIQYLLAHGAEKIILISHLGRPKGEVRPELSLRPVATVLQNLLIDRTVAFVDQTTGAAVQSAVEQLSAHGVLLLENLRFHPEEEANNPDFAKSIVDATHADLFVQDGFAVVHRAHASTSAICSLLPSVAGLLVEKEVSTLTDITEHPAHPFYAIIGGAKVEDKQPLIDKLLTFADEIWVGGKIAANGYNPDEPRIHVAKTFATDDSGAKLDISAAAATELTQLLQSQARTVLWNGVLGLVEQPPFDHASQVVAEAIGHQANLTSVICGGDTSGFVENLQSKQSDLQYTLVSTGGGASLELLSGLPLPGIDALASK